MKEEVRSGPGWEARSNLELVVDGIIYTGYLKVGSGRDVYMKVGNREFCFQDRTPYQQVVDIIRHNIQKELNNC